MENTSNSANRVSNSKENMEIDHQDQGQLHSQSQSQSQSENESTVSSRSRYSESSQQPPIANFSAAKFIRRRRARMLGISSSSSSKTPSNSKSPSFPPMRLRRSIIKSESSSNSSEKCPKVRKCKLARVKPPPLTPMQIEIRRLYDSIVRSHRKTMRESINQTWDDNWKNVNVQMKHHDRFQRVRGASSFFLTRGVENVTADDIMKASDLAVKNRITTVDKVKVTVMSNAVNSKEDQRVPIVTIGNVTQIPPVLDWTAIPHNMHEDDGKFLTNIPFLGDEFIDKDSNFLDEMMTLYEGKVHEDSDASNYKKIRDDVLYNLVQTMVKIEADAPGVFNEVKQDDEVKSEEKKDESIVTTEDALTEKDKTSFSDVAAKLFVQNQSPSETQPQNVGENSTINTGSLSNESEISESVSDALTSAVEESSSGEWVPSTSASNTDSDVKINDSPEKIDKSLKMFGNQKEFFFSGEMDLNCEDSSVKPSDAIFTILSTTFKGIGNPNEIREKYESAERSRNAPPLPILPNGMEQQKPESYSIPNIEGPFAKYLPKEATMHAYQFLFCRRCFTYDCKRHTGDDQVEAKHYKRNRQIPPIPPPSSSASTSSASALNFVCENPDCWQKKELPCRSAEEIIAEWTPSDRSLFLCFIDSFPSNYCFISFLMRNKSCVQVKEYADLENVIPEEESTRTMIAPRAKTKHRKKASISHTKKNAVTRRWINKVKKTKELAKEGGMKCPGGFLPVRYMPCLHENGEECDASCTCRINKTSCEKFCTCALTCPYRFPGCKCLSTCDSKRCICFAAARECDPDLCLGCGANEVDLEKISCHNVNIQRKLHKHLLMGRSDISGWGIYIKNDAQKGEFIAEYRGELISYDESERRGHVYDKIQHTFLFELNDHFVVDATRKGNKARFVNSSKNPNCEVKRMLVNGDHRIGIYAKRYIEAGEELFYDYEDVLEKQQKAAEAASNRKRKD